MPLFANTRALVESAAPKPNKTNQLANRPSLPPNLPLIGENAQLELANRSDRAANELAEASTDPGTLELSQARTSAVIAKQIILTNALESLVAQASLLDWDSLRLLR